MQAPINRSLCRVPEPQHTHDDAAVRALAKDLKAHTDMVTLGNHSHGLYCMSRHARSRRLPDEARFQQQQEPVQRAAFTGCPARPVLVRGGLVVVQPNQSRGCCGGWKRLNTSATRAMRASWLAHMHMYMHMYMCMCMLPAHCCLPK